MIRSNKKRLFFALWPDDQVRFELHRLQSTLELSDGRLVHEADLHITLQYLGQVTGDQLACIKTAASRVEVTPFRLGIDSVHHWRRPRVLWAGLAFTPHELQCLVQQLGEQLAACGFTPENRLYCPHVTLARKVKAALGAQLTDAVSWEANEFVLVESYTDGRIPRYEPVARYPLD